MHIISIMQIGIDLHIYMYICIRCLEHELIWD